MYKKWNTIVKPALEDYYTGVTTKFQNMKNLIHSFFKVDVKKLIKNLNTNNDLKEKITKKFLYLKEINLP